jgi:LacI family transcriptional regulator
VIVPNVLDDYFAKVIHAIELEASKNNYKLVICLSNDNLQKETESIALLLNGTVDGILLSLSKETQNFKSYKHFDSILNRQFPMVMFDRITEDVICDKITVNDFEASYEATAYLYHTKCKKIAFLSTIAQTSVSKLRKNGYCQALKDFALNHPIIINISNYNDFDTILEHALKTNEIDAIIAADQFSAVCTLYIIQKNNIKVPEDISVIGFTDSLLAKYTLPALTTISQNAEVVGRVALRTLLERIENVDDDPPSHRVIKTELIVRNSTKKIEL